MNFPPMSTRITIRPEQHTEMDTHLYGHRLLLARTVWLTVVVLTLGVFFASLPTYIKQLQIACAGSACAYLQLSPPQAHAFQSIGLSLNGYASYVVTLVILSAVTCFGIGGVIFWRKSDDWMALLFALLFVLGGTIFVSETTEASHSVWRLPNLFLNELAFALLFLVFALFPDGRFVPSWTRWLVVGYLAAEVVHIYITFPDTPIGQVRYPLLLLLVWFAELACLLFAQIYRYRHVSSPAQRQQTKWIVFSLIVGIIMGVLSYLPLIFRLTPLNVLFATTIAIVALFICPVFVAIAILRYRLWDIDIIINRTLVYGTLTVALALLYFGLIFALQSLFQGMFHQNNAVAIVISTLAIAALFQPLRRRLQSIIDRRFYRRKYDAAKTVAAFSATLRNEIDLTQLSEHLIAVVQETMQPSHVSLWLRKPEKTTNSNLWEANRLSALLEPNLPSTNQQQESISYE